MNHPHTKIIKLIVISFAFTLAYSCSKDSDLLTDSVISDAKEENLVVQNYLVNDTYLTRPGEAIVLDVLSNDVFINPDKVKIIETSAPVNGEVIIIENKTILYIPNSAVVNEESLTDEETVAQESEETSEENTNTEEEATVEEESVVEEEPVVEEAVEEAQSTEEVTDDFTYTVEVENEDETVTEQVASVTVTETEQAETGPASNLEEVNYWKNQFDSYWNTNSSQISQWAASRNKNQEYYFFGYYIDGLISIWRATGDNSYLDRAIGLIDQTMNDAVDVGGGYRGWPANDGQQYGLWDSYYWRHVATLTRVLYQSPNLRNSNGSYQSAYERLLNFSERNIWERYESQGQANFYRVNTHMASHWARIGMELYIITGKSKYKEVFDNISFGTMPGRPSNLRNQLRQNSSVPSAYTWSAEWTGGATQDVDHAGAIVGFWVVAHDNGMYWNWNDMQALMSTLEHVVWKESDGEYFSEYVDGSGTGLFGRLNGWLRLGRYSQRIQNRIRDQYATSRNLSFYGPHALGIAGLNARILSDGKAVYPE